MTIINMTGGKAGKPPVYQGRTIQPTQFPTTVTPQAGYDALSQVTVNAPSNLLAQNIRKDVNIAGVVGTYEAISPTINLQQKTVTPKSYTQVLTADSGYDGLSQVTVSGDSDLVASNIKSGVEIFGVTGSYVGDVSRDTVGNISYDFESSGPTFPMILTGPYNTTFDSGTISLGSAGAGVFGNKVNFAYNAQRGQYAGFGATVMSSSWFSIKAGEYLQVRTNSYKWSNTNRDSTTMDEYLEHIAARMDNNYFSGNLSCYKAWVWWSSSTWGSCISSGISVHGPVSVPFTYSNGNVTYSLSSILSSDDWNFYSACNPNDDPIRAQPALYLNSIHLNGL